MPLQILFLTHRVPYPLTDGGAMVSDFMISGFLEHHIDLSLISLNTSKHYVTINKLPAYYKKLTYFDTVDINNDVTVHGAINNLFSSDSYHTSRFKSKAFNKKISALLQIQEFDFVILDNIFLQDTIDTIRKFSTAKIACRIHNIEHLIWRNLATNTKLIIKKKYLQLQANRLQKIELLTLQKVDLLLLLNAHEGMTLKLLNIQTAQYLLPFGINILDDEIVSKLKPNKCFHLASMDWLPNVEALDWFLAKVFPIIIDKNPDFELHIGGKNMPEKYLALNSKNIIAYTSVLDAKQFMKSNGICIVPLLSGAGIRVKILEAMSIGVPVVSTKLGASGLMVDHNIHLLIADTAIAFADAVLSSTSSLINIAKNGKENVMLHYQKKQIMQETKNYLNQLLHA